MIRKSAISAILLLLVLPVVAVAVFRASPEAAAAPLQPPMTGNEQPREGCFFSNGFNVCNYGEANLKDTYLRFKDYLGAPLSSFDSWSQLFVFGKLSYNPGNPAGWKVEIANMGLMDYQARGFTAQPGSEPHPALRDWLISQLEVNVDTGRLVGRIISPPLCDNATGMCRQWTDKQAFVFPKDAISGSQVQRVDLGLSTVHPPPPVTKTSEVGLFSFTNLPLLVFVAALLLSGLAWLVAKSSTSGGERPTA